MSCDMTAKTQTGVAKSSGPFGAVLGLLLGALALFLFTAPTGQLMQGEYFYSLLNKRGSKQICFLH